jgi:uncharacterized membrane protein YdjX (TVP38/TMEM64 family)
MANKPKPAEKSFGELLRDLSTRPLPKGIVIALLLALTISFASITIVEMFDGAAKMRAWIENAGAWAPLVYILLKASTYVIAPLSGTPVKLAAGALFGFWEGAALALVGDTLGASLNFWIARLFRDRGISKIAGKKSIKQIDQMTEHVGGWRALLAARLLLSSLYDFISYAAGISNLQFKHFFWVTVLAGVPSTLFAAWLGNSAVTNKSFMYALFTFSAIALVATLLLQYFSAKKQKPGAKE